MFNKLLLIGSALLANGSVLTLETPQKAFNTVTPNRFIDNSYPSYRIGNYQITDIEHVSAAGGQVRFNRIQVIVPHVDINTLGQYDNVYISIPYYDYNQSVNLYMRIDFYNNNVLNTPVYYDMAEIPLSETMLKVLPYTIVDLPIQYNIFDVTKWDQYDPNELRLTFLVPALEYSDPPVNWQEHLKDITLFTRLEDGDGGSYIYGYEDGYNDGYRDGLTGAEIAAEGNWLGSLVFGTIGGIVGFLFAISDFEVLGVSIMSIITLFVAIGIITLLLKVLK